MTFVEAITVIQMTSRFRLLGALSCALAGLAACTDAGPLEVAVPVTDSRLAPLIAAEGTPIDGSYIVVLKEGHETGSDDLRPLGNTPSGSAAHTDGGAVAARVFAGPTHVFSGAVRGFAAELDERQLDALRRDPSVAYIEQDQVITIAVSGSGTVTYTSQLDGNKCFTASRATSGSAVVISTCTGGANQEFRWNGSELRLGTLCVDASSGRGEDGNPIILWSCNGGANQKWALTSAGELKGINGKCIDVPRRNTTDGTGLILWSCHGATNQKWSLRTQSSSSGLIGITTQRMDSHGDPWGLDRISQRSLPLLNTYIYRGNGSRVNAYVIDTGIQASHPEFGGRARSVYDAFGGRGSDCNGHGTGVAGTIGGKTFGVAKNVQIHSLKIADCNGSGRSSALLAAMDWVRRNHSKPAVVNISIQTRHSPAINDAATALVNAGVFVSVAAGNNNADACSFSPGSASGVVTVGASTKTDQRASYSNFGSCVNLYAPGTGVRSANIGSGAANWTGTSIAAPHVAGVAALYLHGNPGASPSAVRSWIQNNALSGVIRSNPSGTPNRLLFKADL